MYCSCSVKKKQKKFNKIINNNENLNYRGIDLNKVSGYSHSANNIQIYKRDSKNNDNKNTDNHIQTFEKGKSLINNNDYYHKSNKGIKNNNEHAINNNEKNFYNKINNKNISKGEYFRRKQNGNNNYFEQQYQNSLPSNIPETEIINNPGESLTFTGIDNTTNRNNNNYVVQYNNEKYEPKNNEKINDIFFKINKLKNEIKTPEIKDNKNKACINYNNYKNSLRYYRDGINNTNFNDYKKNISNKENNPMNFNKINDNYYNDNSNKFQINGNINNNNNYFKNAINSNDINNNNTVNKDFIFNKTATFFNSIKNNLTKNINNNETYNINKEASSTTKNPFFDFNLKNFSKTQTKNNKNLSMTNFNYNNNNNKQKQNENLDAHNFFGIEMNENRLEKLLKIIPRHIKENKFLSYKSYVLSLKKQEKNNENNKNPNNIFALHKAKTFDEDFNEIMPANIFNY
jgi:hypothetical protein